MDEAQLDVRYHDGYVELELKLPDDDEVTILYLDAHTARRIGDKMFTAGCTASL